MAVFPQRFFREDDGSVLVVALLILVVLTLLGISATTTTEIELQIAGNEKASKVAFYNADSGVYTTPKLIRSCVANNLQPVVAGITYLDTVPSNAFYRQVWGYDAYDNGVDDISYTIGGNNVLVDVNRDRVEHLAGGMLEFGSGADGIGGGSTGGVAIIYVMDSTGQGPRSSEAEIIAEYRLVPGVAGGL